MYVGFHDQAWFVVCGLTRNAASRLTMAWDPRVVQRRLFLSNLVLSCIPFLDLPTKILVFIFADKFSTRSMNAK